MDIPNNGDADLVNEETIADLVNADLLKTIADLVKCRKSSQSVERERDERVFMNVTRRGRFFLSLAEEREWRYPAWQVRQNSGESVESDRSDFEPAVKAAKYLKNMLAVLLISIGVFLISLVHTRSVAQAELCETLYTPCLWSGVQPKIYFSSGGLFGAETSCGEEHFVEIIGRNCGLEEIPAHLNAQVEKLQKVRTLDLAGNHLRFLGPKFLDLPNLETVHLQGNPAAEMLDWSEQGLETLPVWLLREGNLFSTTGANLSVKVADDRKLKKSA